MICRTKWTPFSIDSVRELRFVENQFVQVLVNEFTLDRRAKGIELSLAFDDNSPTITSRPTKVSVQSSIPEFAAKAASLQKKLDNFLLFQKGSCFKYQDRTFPFRYASGGTLPIIRLNKKDYFCLFYREIFPIGWNIANGGCLTRDELLNPLATVEREFVEELVVVNRFKHTYGVFADDKGRQVTAPRWLGSDSIWRSILGDSVNRFEKAEVPAKWFAGPDSLKVDIGGECNQITDCFVNINAEDYGIEIDRIVKIAPDSDSVYCDGEQAGNVLMNRLVGLFEVEKTEKQLASGIHWFVPDRFYFSGRERDADQFLHVIRKEVVPHSKGFRSPSELSAFEAAIRADQHLRLCPVTQRILIRYAQRERVSAEHQSCVVFVSYGGSDEYTARKIYDELRHSVSTFFFKEYSHRDVLSRSIDDALDSAACLIVPCSILENIRRDRCAYEWKRFCREWSAGLKPSNAVVIPFVASDINPEDLPRELREHFVVPFRPASFDKDLLELAKRIPSELRKAASQSSIA